jgi:hypothetical protein
VSRTCRKGSSSSGIGFPSGVLICQFGSWYARPSTSDRSSPRISSVRSFAQNERQLGILLADCLEKLGAVLSRQVVFCDDTVEASITEMIFSLTGVRCCYGPNQVVVPPESVRHSGRQFRFVTYQRYICRRWHEIIAYVVSVSLLGYLSVRTRKRSMYPLTALCTSHTGGCKFVKISYTPGCRVTSVCCSHQYQQYLLCHGMSVKTLDTLFSADERYSLAPILNIHASFKQI